MKNRWSQFPEAELREIVLGIERASLKEWLGGGNDGDVYRLKGDPSRAVKIYKYGERQAREEKIRAAVAANLGQKPSLVAFPLQVATSNSGEFLGFSMPLMSDRREIQQLYNPKSRLHHYPDIDYRFVVRVAQNVARAVGAVQSLGGNASQKVSCVIGNLNHSGLLVAKDATVALINADRFQYTINGKIYPNAAGVPEYTPPELLSNCFEDVLKTCMHTNFGLAVVIFHLLFMGRHPYAGRYAGPIVSLSEAIARNRFAYSASKQYATKTMPPNGALTLDCFPDAISHKFENAFGLKPEMRPSAEDWISVLSSFENALNRCTKVPTHYYPDKSKECIWCNLRKNGSIDMFPGHSVERPSPAVKTEADGSLQSSNAARTGRTQNPTSAFKDNVEKLPDIPHNGATDNHRCPRCKKDNEAGASYCRSCGFQLSDGANPDSVTLKDESHAESNGCLKQLASIVIYTIIGFFTLLIILSLV